MKTAKRALALLLSVLMLTGGMAFSASAAFDLQSAIDAVSAGATLTLPDDLKTSVVINKDLTIDMGGHDLVGEDGKNVIVVEGANVTVRNGRVSSRFANVPSAEMLKTVVGESPSAIRVNGGSLTLEGVRVVGSFTRVPGDTHKLPTGSAIEAHDGATVTVVQSSLIGRYGVNNKVASGSAPCSVTIEDGILAGFLNAVKDMSAVVLAQGTEDVNAADRIEGILNSGITLEPDERALMQSVLGDKIHIYTKPVSTEVQIKVVNCVGDAEATAYVDESRVWANTTSTDASYRFIPEAVTSDGKIVAQFAEAEDGAYKASVKAQDAQGELKVKYRLQFVLQDDAAAAAGNFDALLTQTVAAAVRIINDVYGEACAQYDQYMQTLYDVDDLLTRGLNEAVHTITGKYPYEIPEYQYLLAKLFALGGAVMVNKGEFTGERLKDGAVYGYTGEMPQSDPENGIYGVLDRVAQFKSFADEIMPLDTADQSRWAELAGQTYGFIVRADALLADLETALLGVKSALNNGKIPAILEVLPQAQQQAAKIDTALAAVDKLQGVIDSFRANDTVQSVLQTLAASEDKIIPYTQKVLDVYNNRAQYFDFDTLFAEGGKVCKGYAVYKQAELIDSEEPLHDWDDGQVLIPATCQEKGLRLFTCRNNPAHVRTEEIPFADHTYNPSNAVVTPPSCNGQGETWNYCIVCGTETVTINEPALGHDYSIELVTPATCEADGSVTYTCSRCGDVIQGETLPASGHDWDAGIMTKDPGCTTPGVMTYTCQNDPSHTITAEIPALDHLYATHIIEPTCEDKGYRVYMCDRCGEVFYRTDDKPAIGHKWDAGTVITAPGCLTDGVIVYTCHIDGSHTRVETLPALGHNFEKIENESYDALCTQDGLLVSVCSRCQERKEEVLPAAGHKYDAIIKEATCDAPGYTVYVCSVCGDTYTGDFQPALHHKWDIANRVIRDATCTEDGEIRYVCLNDSTHILCRDTYDQYKDDPNTPQVIIPALGHLWEDPNGIIQPHVVNPTCEEEGYTEYYCFRCGVTNRVSDPVKDKPLGHKWIVSEAVPATCDEARQIIYTCQNDFNHTKIETEGNPLGHAWDAGTVIRPATCTEPALKVFTCTRNANHTDTREDGNPLGHKWIKETFDPLKGDKEATCTSAGSHRETCMNDVSHTRVVIEEMKEHEWGPWYVVRQATMTEQGLKRCDCRNCDAYKTMVIPCPKPKLQIRESYTNLSGNHVSVTIPYSRKGEVATFITAVEEEGLDLYLTFDSSDEKTVTVDNAGTVRFTRLSMFHSRSTITVRDQFGRTATCDIHVKLTWYQYLIWFLFGWLWY